jgi:hypothetical protein
MTKRGVAYGNGNKVVINIRNDNVVGIILECAATPRFLRALRLVEMTPPYWGGVPCGDKVENILER